MKRDFERDIEVSPCLERPGGSTSEGFAAIDADKDNKESVKLGHPDCGIASAIKTATTSFILDGLAWTPVPLLNGSLSV
ncbi:hypothetical protein V8E36_002286 [Tilletia maclaganii]